MESFMHSVQDKRITLRAFCSERFRKTFYLEKWGVHLVVYLIRLIYDMIYVLVLRMHTGSVNSCYI